MELIHGLADSLPELANIPFSFLAQQRLQLGERLLN
jgi:hypothetical protein